MKWIIIAIVVVVVGIWLARGRRKNPVENPEMKTVEKQDYYISPEDEAEQHKSASDRDHKPE